MVLSPVSPSIARAASAKSSLDSDRHVVRVTFMMSMPPAAEPVKNEQAPTKEQEPIRPVAVPEIEAVSDAEPTAPPPSAAKPPVPNEPIAQEPTVQPEQQPIALDLPATERTDAPLPPIAEASDSERTEPIEPTEQVAEISEPTEQPSTDVPAEPVAQADSAKPTTTNATTESADPPTQPEQTAEASQDPTPTKPETEPTETTADATPAAPPPTPKEATEDERPAAVVYHEDSVDEPIAFDKMARPKTPAVSKRLGESGTVRILIEVDALGNLIRHEVIDDPDHARLLKAALAALQDSTFLPARHEDQPVHSTRIIEYRF